MSLIKKILVIMLILVAILSVFIAVYAVYPSIFALEHEQDNVIGFICILVFLLCLYLLFLLLTWERRCPSCKKLLALVSGVPVNAGVGRGDYDSEFAIVKTHKYGGKTVEKESRKVNYTHSIHEILLTCKYCGAKYKKTVSGY